MSWSTMTMSLIVLPSASPGASSGSLLVTETSVTAGAAPELSVAVIVVFTVVYL